MEKIKKSILLSFIIVACCSLAAWAQIPGEKILHQKVQRQLQHIIKHTHAVTGLVAIDLTTGNTSFAFNGNYLFPQASAIKIPLLMTLYKQVQEGDYSISDVKKVTRDDVVGGSGVLKNMKMPVNLSIYNLCILMMTVSDNTATNTLIDLVGMEKVNKTMRSLGFDKTRLQRKMMDVKSSARGQENLSTPKEAAHILELLYRGKYISNNVSDEILSYMKKAPRRESYLAAGLPDDVSIAFKYGSLKGVATEWALVLLPERPYAVAFMQSYAAPEDGGVQNIVSISKILYRYFWKLGNSTEYGVYRPPELIKK